MAGGTGVTPLPEVRDEEEQEVITRGKKPAVSMSAKAFELKTPVEEPITPEVTTAPEDDVTESEAALRGGAAGLTFDLADDVVAAFQSLGSSETFQQKLKKQQKREEMAAEKFPVKYYGAMGVGGAASMFIPGVGPIANTARAVSAAKALKAAKAAKNAAGIAVARQALTKELVKGGAATGALSGFGASEKESPLDVAADMLTGAATGGVLGAAVPRAVEAAGEGAKRVGRAALEKFPGLKPIAEGIGEGVEKAKGAIEKVWEGDRWQVPEFAGTPKKQRRVDEIVKQGKELNLTDRQILNNIAVEFRELSRDTLENIFEQKGVAGTFKRVLGGSQEAAEFIDRPEQMAYAEEATKGETAAMAKQAKDIELTKGQVAEKADVKTQLSRESQDLTQKLGEKRRELQQRWETADVAEKQRINQELAKVDNTEKQLKTVMEQRKTLIDQYEQADKDMIQTVKTEMEKAAKTRSEESLTKIGQIERELDERVKQLGQERSALVESLMDTPASEAELRAAFDMKRNLQQVFEGGGMGNQARQALNDAFGGDTRFDRVKRFFDIKDAQRDFDINQSNLEWNKKNGFWDEQKMTVKPGGKPAIAMKPDSRPQLTEEDIPAVGELVGAMYAANAKVSSAATGTPLANVKRQVAITVQEGMKDLSNDAYALQRYLNRVKSNLETLRASPLFESRKIPFEGQTGRIATPTKRLIKTEIPQNYAKSAKQYRGIMSIITQGESMEAADVARAMKAAKGGLPVKPSPRIGQLQREVGDIESRIAGLADERQRILDQQRVQAADVKLARGEEKRAAIGETVKSKLELRNRLRQIDDEVSKLNEQLTAQGRRKAEMGETEAQLITTLRGTEGVPTSARDVAQFGTIAAKGEVPWISGKLLPSPATRIRVFNKIKTQFANPSLNSAVRVALERPITTEVIRSLAQTHNVPEDQLAEVIGSELKMQAKPLDSVPQEVQPAVQEPAPEMDFYQRGIEGVKSPTAKRLLMEEYETIMAESDNRIKRIKLNQLQDKILEELGAYSE